MARENPTWDGGEDCGDELSLTPGIRISPRTVRKYLRCGRPRESSGQRWSAFVGNHATAIEEIAGYKRLGEGGRLIADCMIAEHI